MLDKFLRLTWVRSLIIVAAWVSCVVLHNAVYAMFYHYFAPGGDEAFFFLLAIVVIPVYAVASVVYTIVSLVRQSGATRKKPA